MKQSKRALSMLLAVLMVLATGIAAVLPVAADDGGNEAKIGETEYATLGEAIDAAESGDTITLLKNLTWKTEKKSLEKDITIDGGTEKYKITSTVSYLFEVYRNITLKNLTMDTKGGFLLKNTAGETSIATIENVDWTVGSELLVNILGATDAVQTLNITNSTITKLSGSAQSLIANTDKTAGTDINVTINIENSKLTQSGGATDAIEKRSIFYFANKADVTLNLKGNSALNYAPQGSANVANGLFYLWKTKVVINVESTVSLNLLETGAATKENYFVYKYSSGGGTMTITDNGAAWNVSAAIAERGFYLPASGSYDVNGTRKALVSSNCFAIGTDAQPLTYRKSKNTYTKEDLDIEDYALSGYTLKIGETLYNTWEEALKVGGEIKLIANAPNISSQLTLTKDVVIDGQGKYIFSSSAYFFALAAHKATFRNLSLNVYQGIGTNKTNGGEVLFENCNIDVTGGLLLNIQANAKVTFQNTTVNSTATDPVILIKNKAVSEIQLVNSTIDYRKGSIKYTDNTSIFNIADGANATVTVDSDSKLIYSPNNTMTNNQIFSVHDTSTVANITLKSGATLEYNAAPSKVTSLVFLRNASAATLNLVDEGATWTVSAAVAKKKFQFVKSADDCTFNCKTVAMKAADGKLYSPTSVITLTAKTSFAPIGMGVSNETGASIRLSEPTGIRFGTKIDKDFFVALGSSAVYGVKVARKDVLQNGNFAVLTADNSVSYDSASETFRWVTEGAFFRTVLMGIGKDNYETALCWNAYVTITYADGTTATFWADWTEADNCRSLAQVAQSALADTTVTWTEAEAALLHTIAGN